MIKIIKKNFLKKSSSKIKETLDNENPWKIIISDDDQEIHEVTKLVLSKESFQNRTFEFISAYSALDTINLLKEHPDTALILLDVVMEEEHSGLKLVKYIRETIQNHNIRIILRTGQPGVAPEKDVVSKYEINDYREKTELSSQKLYTSIINSLRSYNDLIKIEKNRYGLEKIIKSCSSLHRKSSFKSFIEGVLIQLSSILSVTQNSMFIKTNAKTVDDFEHNAKILAGTGEFAPYCDIFLKEITDKNLYSNIERCFLNESNIYSKNEYIVFFKTNRENKNILYLNGSKTLSYTDKYLIDLFASNIAIAVENMELLSSQLEMTNKFLIKSKEFQSKNRVYSDYLDDISLKINQEIENIEKSRLILEDNLSVSLNKKHLRLISESSKKLNKLIKELKQNKVK